MGNCPAPQAMLELAQEARMVKKLICVPNHADWQ